MSARIAELEAENARLLTRGLSAKTQREWIEELEAEVTKLRNVEAELAGWKRVACEAAIPLEAMRMAGSDKLLGRLCKVM